MMEEIEKKFIKRSIISKTILYVLFVALFVKNIDSFNFNEIKNSELNLFIKILCFIPTWGATLFFFFGSFYFPYNKRGVKWVILEICLFSALGLLSFSNLFKNQDYHILLRIFEPAFYSYFVYISYKLLKLNKIAKDFQNIKT
jgi:hypothetical protein